MGHSIFKADYPLIIQWFNQKGYSGSLNEMIIRYFQSKVNGTPIGHANDLVALYLRQQGLSGDIGQMLNTFFTKQMGVTDPLLAQRLFFNSSTNDFSSGNDSYTKFLLHMDGTNGSTTFTDSSSNPKTFTAGGGAVIDTSTSVFGGASGNFVAASSSIISCPDSSDFTVGSNDFTFDTRIYITSDPATVRQFVFANYTTNADMLYIEFPGDGTIACKLIVASVGQFNIVQSWAPSLNTWYHLAIVRSSGNIYHFVNGTQVGSAGAASTSVPDFSSGIFIGQQPGATQYFNGHLDEVRFSNGIARWTSNFTPPTSAYS